MQTEGKSQKLLRIHRDDNVLIVVAPIRPGDREMPLRLVPIANCYESIVQQSVSDFALPQLGR